MGATWINLIDPQSLANVLANFPHSNLPLGMTDCEAIGISGGCGPYCAVFLRGECEEAVLGVWSEIVLEVITPKGIPVQSLNTQGEAFRVAKEWGGSSLIEEIKIGERTSTFLFKARAYLPERRGSCKVFSPTRYTPYVSKGCFLTTVQVTTYQASMKDVDQTVARAALLTAMKHIGNGTPVMIRTKSDEAGAVEILFL